jgi:hypothetical protein
VMTRAAACARHRHLFYMMQFRTTYCPDFPVYKCDRAKPYTCVHAHYENHLRRCPVVEEPGSGALRFLYTANLCQCPSLMDCPDGARSSSLPRVRCTTHGAIVGPAWALAGVYRLTAPRRPLTPARRPPSCRA